MLVLSRKQDDTILIGDSVCIKVVAVSGSKVRLGITAPADVAIRRGEVDFFSNSGDRIRNGSHKQMVEFHVPVGTSVV